MDNLKEDYKIENKKRLKKTLMSLLLSSFMIIILFDFLNEIF
jgi:hypothetical protein